MLGKKTFQRHFIKSDEEWKRMGFLGANRAHTKLFSKTVRGENERCDRGWNVVLCSWFFHCDVCLHLWQRNLFIFALLRRHRIRRKTENSERSTFKHLSSLTTHYRNLTFRNQSPPEHEIGIFVAQPKKNVHQLLRQQRDIYHLVHAQNDVMLHNLHNLSIFHSCE